MNDSAWSPLGAWNAQKNVNWSPYTSPAFQHSPSFMSSPYHDGGDTPSFSRRSSAFTAALRPPGASASSVIAASIAAANGSGRPR
nr:hypothetical protein GCM10025732_16170 [Glycomyces mayteni]